MNELIQQFEKYIVQIATPYSRGTGFYLPQYDLIVTNEHVVRDNREVVIDGLTFGKQLSPIIYLDALFDLAFIKTPEVKNIPDFCLLKDILTAGTEVWSLGQPFGSKFMYSKGIINNVVKENEDLEFIYHTALLNPGNSGGVLINNKGEIIGVNTFLIADGKFTGFALPVHFLLETIEEFRKKEGEVAARCASCKAILFEKNIQKQKCPHCHQKVVLATQIKPYAPSGVAKTIEDMLSLAGYQVELSRRGPGNWEIQQGSAHIHISYYDKTGLIIGDAYLCSLPAQNPKPLYEFLLKQNYEIEGLTFSIKEQDIVLSLLIYDRYLNIDTGKKLFKHLFEMADYYDNILVEEYGAQWRTQDEIIERG